MKVFIVGGCDLNFYGNYRPGYNAYMITSIVDKLNTTACHSTVIQYIIPYYLLIIGIKLHRESDVGVSIAPRNTNCMTKRLSLPVNF